MKIPLPVHSYEHVSRPVGTERLVNMYVERSPDGAKGPVCLMATPGTVTVSTTNRGGGRGAINYNGTLYFVAGTTMYSCNNLGAISSIGTIAGAGPVTFATTPTQLVICGNTTSYVYESGALSAIADADFDNGVQCGGLDGYVLFRRASSGVFFSSDLNDATSYDALMFATAEGLADNLTGLIVDHRQIVLTGSDSTEIWFNSGSAGFPFTRDSNGYLEIGCLSGDTLAKMDNSIAWLASDFTVRRLDGLTPVRISQHGVEQAIATYTTSDAFAFSYTEGGHIFYVLQFPTDQKTWVYDATTNEWHERETYPGTFWDVGAMAFAYGRWYVISYDQGHIGYLSHTEYEEFDDTKTWSMTFPSVYNDGNRVLHSSFEALFETGVGLVTGQGSDPQVTLEYSNDGGRTWTTAATKSMGVIGQYRARVRWNSLGSARDRIYRLSGSDPVKTIISDAQVTINAA